jgi:hypothetical protein
LAFVYSTENQDARSLEDQERRARAFAYIKAIRRQTHRGLEGRALSGSHTGGKPYGYGSIPEPNPADPEKPRRLRVIDPTEAEVVRRVFQRLRGRKVAARDRASSERRRHHPASRQGEGQQGRPWLGLHDHPSDAEEPSLGK